MTFLLPSPLCRDDLHGNCSGDGWPIGGTGAADIADNTQPERLEKLDDATVARLIRKYAKAKMWLEFREPSQHAEVVGQENKLWTPETGGSTTRPPSRPPASRHAVESPNATFGVC